MRGEAALFKGEGPLAKELLKASGIMPDTFLWQLMEAMAEWVDSDARTEERQALVHVLTEELGEKQSVVAVGINAWAYRGLLVTDGQKLIVPSVPHRLFRSVRVR